MNPIKKNDQVRVKTGRDKGKTGEVLKVFPGSGRVLVSKINLVKRHTRPTGNQPGGIQEKEAAIHHSSVQVVCPKCSQPTRVRFERMETGEKARLCRRCGEMIL